MLSLFEETKNIFAFFLSFSLTLKSCKLWRFTLMDDKNINISYDKYHGCWWLNESRSHDISRHGVDLVILEYSSLCTRRFNTKHYSIKQWFRTINEWLLWLNCSRLFFIYLYISYNFHHLTCFSHQAGGPHWSTMVQEMIWCLMAPSHHLNQCWQIPWGLIAFLEWVESQILNSQVSFTK